MTKIPTKEIQWPAALLNEDAWNQYIDLGINIAMTLLIDRSKKADLASIKTFLNALSSREDAKQIIERSATKSEVRSIDPLIGESKCVVEMDVMQAVAIGVAMNHKPENSNHQETTGLRHFLNVDHRNSFSLNAFDEDILLHAIKLHSSNDFKNCVNTIAQELNTNDFPELISKCDLNNMTVGDVLLYSAKSKYIRSSNDDPVIERPFVTAGLAGNFSTANAIHQCILKDRHGSPIAERRRFLEESKDILVKTLGKGIYKNGIRPKLHLIKYASYFSGESEKDESRFTASRELREMQIFASNIISGKNEKSTLYRIADVMFETLTSLKNAKETWSPFLTQIMFDQPVKMNSKKMADLIGEHQSASMIKKSVDLAMQQHCTPYLKFIGDDAMRELVTFRGIPGSGPHEHELFSLFKINSFNENLTVKRLSNTIDYLESCGVDVAHHVQGKPGSDGSVKLPVATALQTLASHLKDAPKQLNQTVKMLYEKGFEPFNKNLRGTHEQEALNETQFKDYQGFVNALKARDLAGDLLSELGISARPFTGKH